jgi:hypothetical protein
MRFVLRPQPAHELYQQLSDAARAASAACPAIHHLIRIQAGRIGRIIAEAEQTAGGGVINGTPLRLIHTATFRLLNDTLHALRVEQILRQQHTPLPN